MTTKNGKLKNSKKAKNTKLDIELFVAPQNGKAKRQVVARRGDHEFPDMVNPFEASGREKFVARVAKAWGIDDPEALQHLDSILVTKAQEADALAEQAAQEAEDESAGAGAASACALADTPKPVMDAAHAFLTNPNMMEELAEDLEKLGIAGESQLALTEYIVGTSRKLDEPLGASVKSSSSSGKSFVTENVAFLFPPEDVLTATDITANALYYLPPNSLKHKLIVVGERKHMNSRDDGDNANATLALREMMSRGRLDKYVPLKSAKGMETAHIVQEGPIAYLETTTQQEIFEEDSTRMLPLATDESIAQTEAVMQIQAKKKAWVLGSPEVRQQIQLKHQTAQRMLESRKVCIPFAEKLLLPATKLVARRAFPQLLGFIEAVALLRQFVKKIHQDGHIVATVADYEIAYGLMLPVFRRTFAPLSQRALTLFGVIKEKTLGAATFTRGDCSKWAGVGGTEVRNRLMLLVEAGLVEQVNNGRQGVRYEYRLVTLKADQVPVGLEALITPQDLQKALKKKSVTAKSLKEAEGVEIDDDDEVEDNEDEDEDDEDDDIENEDDENEDENEIDDEDDED